MGGGSDLQRLSGGENCVLGPRRGVPSALHKLNPGDDASTEDPHRDAIKQTSRRWCA